MHTAIGSSIMRNIVFAWIALGTCLVLLVPLLAMQFTAAVDWDVTDFVMMGVLAFGTGSLFVLAARRGPRRHWLVLGAVFAMGFFYVWAELAVGIFAHLGS